MNVKENDKMREYYRSFVKVYETEDKGEERCAVKLL